MSDNRETVNVSDIRNKQISRAQGCLVGQLAGDAIGSLVEFQVPERWIDTLSNCRPEKGTPRVYQPRPECFWPIDALELASQLVAADTEA